MNYLDEELMTRTTLANKFGVTTRTVCRWEKKGLPIIKIGGLIRYSPAEVNKWIDLKNFSKEKLT